MADDWESLADDGTDVPPPQGGGMNTGANNFVPNFGAQAFVPGGGGGYAPQGYGGYGGYQQQGGYQQGGGYYEAGAGGRGGGYQQQGYNQGGYQNQRGGYNNQYQQRGYNNQGSYSQGGYNQGNYNQAGYQQQQRGGYNNQYQQHGNNYHNQGGFEKPSFNAMNNNNKSQNNQKHQNQKQKNKQQPGNVSIASKPQQQQQQQQQQQKQQKQKQKQQPMKAQPEKTETKVKKENAKDSSQEKKQDTPQTEKKEQKADKEEKAPKDGGDKPKSEKAQESTGKDSSKEGSASKDPSKGQEPPQEVYVEKKEDRVDPAELEKLDKLERVNIIFIGHVDAGKSTIGGHLMFLTGGVDKRTLEKYEREAREKNRESWYLSWALDTNDEERAKGKTVECGKAAFATDKKHYSIIDAPGHKSFVPNMISGAVQADVAVLVISSRKGEFEAGFERGGQTREHAMLAKSTGVKKLIIAINKMDLHEWNKTRYDECVDKLKPFLKRTGFNPARDCHFMPISGQLGHGLLKAVPKDICPWHDGPGLVEYLDSLPKIQRYLDLPLRLPIADKYSDMGVFAMGKILSGATKKGANLTLMPNNSKVQIQQILTDDVENDICMSGDNVKIKLKGCDEENLQSGYVLCPLGNPCSVCYTFDAQVVLFDYKSIVAPGFQCILHIHTAIEEVVLKGLICYIDKKTGKPNKERGRPRFMKQGDAVIARITANVPICVETFNDNPAMGRFTLRDEGKTIALGKVKKLISIDDSKAAQDAAKAKAMEN